MTLKYPTAAKAAVGAPEKPFHNSDLGTLCCKANVRALRTGLQGALLEAPFPSEDAGRLGPALLLEDRLRGLCKRAPVIRRNSMHTGPLGRIELRRWGREGRGE